jgi:Uma2 family endonuclease
MSTASQVYRPPLLYNGQRLERDEFYRRVDEWVAEGKSPRGIERLEGVVYMPASIRAAEHAEPHGFLVGWLAVYAAATPVVQFGGNATSKLDLNNDPESDAYLRIRPEYGGQTRTDRRGYIDGSPELLIEVTGSSSHRDLEVKFEVYRRNGVLENIVWETIAEELYWFVLENDEYARLAPDANGLLRSRVFPGLWLDVAALLEGNLQRVLDVVQLGIASPWHADFVGRLQRGP